MHQLIEPAEVCRQRGHRIDTRLKQPGPGEYEYCVVCTLGYEMAMARFSALGLEHNVATWRADQFVQDLRRNP